MPKGLYIFTGIIFIINGGIILYSNNLKLLSIIVGVLMILAGLGYLFLSPFKYSQKSKFFPRVKINEVSIWAKTGFWSRPVIVRWEDIREIDLDSYRINFKLKKSSQSFRYNCIPETSVALKMAIREEADSKGIIVNGG